MDLWSQKMFSCECILKHLQLHLSKKVQPPRKTPHYIDTVLNSMWCYKVESQQHEYECACCPDTRRFRSDKWLLQWCELCKASFFSPGGQTSSSSCQFVVIISICSHLKRLANPRSHAGSARRIICVCFLTWRTDSVNLLKGKNGEMEQMWGGKKERQTNVLLMSW